MDAVDWRGRVEEVAELARRAMAPGLVKGEKGTAIYGGSCLYASILVCELVARFSGGSVAVRGGSGEEQTGALDRWGTWRGHYWAVATLGDVRLVVDITGDQFGMEPVRVMAEDDSSGVLRPGPQQEVDVAVSELRRSMGLY